MKTFSIGLATLLLCGPIFAQSYCETELQNLRMFAMAAKYEQLPAEQKPSFFAQLSPDQQLQLMGIRSGNQLGGNSGNSMNEVLNRKSEEFKRKCGFMLK